MQKGASCHIITTSIEHNAVINSCRTLEAEGFAVTYVPCDKYGFIRPETVQSAIRDGHYPHLCHGSPIKKSVPIQPLKMIGANCTPATRYAFHTDAVQAYGHIPINVNECMIDMLSMSAHKLKGPKGTGFLYVRNGLELPAYIDGGSQENGRRAGTSNVPGIVGLGKACEIAARNMSRNINNMTRLRNRIIYKIKKGLPDAVLTGSEQMRLPTTSPFAFHM